MTLPPGAAAGDFVQRGSVPFRRLPVLAIAAMAWLALFPITDIDAYYHLATGKRILDEGRLPSRGVGSATFGQASWHDNEWGFQVLAAAVGRSERDASGVLVLTRGGRAALILFRALCVAATLALVAATLARRGVRPITRALSVVLLAFLTYGNLFWDVRPQSLSFVALAALLYLLERDRDGARWALPCALGLLALWSNVHGAFVIGIALIGAEAAGECLQGVRDPALRRRGFRLMAAAALAPLAACLNPLGFQQVLHTFLYLLRPEIHAGNAEWTRPNLAHLPLFVGSVLLTALATAWSGKVRFAEVLRVSAFLVLFLSAIRHLPLASIVLVPALATALVDASARRGWKAYLDPSSEAWGSPWRRLAAVSILAAAIIGLSGAKFIGVVPRFEERIFLPMPENGVRFIAREGVEGNGFNAYRFGGFLMFRLYPAERVFIDGRNDLYRDFTQEVFFPILETVPGWEALWRGAVSKFGIGWVLIDEASPLAAALGADPDWIHAAPPSGPVVDGSPGRNGIVLFLRNTAGNRERLARWPRMP